MPPPAPAPGAPLRADQRRGRGKFLARRGERVAAWWASGGGIDGRLVNHPSRLACGVVDLSGTVWNRRAGSAAIAREWLWTARAVFRCAPGPALGLIGLQLVLAVAPAATVRVTQHVIDLGLSAAGAGPAALVRLWPWLGLLAVTLVLGSGVPWRFRRPLHDRLSQHVRGVLGRLRLEKASRLPLLAFEQSALHDQLLRTADAGGQAARLFTSALDAGENGIQVATVALLFWPVHPWLPFALLAAVAVGATRAVEKNRRWMSFNYDRTEEQRRLLYLTELMTGRAEQKEMRVFGLHAPLTARWQGLREALRAQMLRRKRQDALFSLPADGLALAVQVGTAVLLAAALARHAIGVGAFVALFGGLGVLQSHAEVFMFHVLGLHTTATEVGYLRAFLALPEEPAAAGPGRPFPTPLAAGIRCTGLSFGYPGANRLVLDGLDLHLRPGERVALVGENGSGKTTLVKLLTGLYPPASGAILADGVDYRRIGPESLRAAVAVVFQDYCNFELTLGESVGLGDPSRLGDRARIAAAAERGGAAEVADGLPQGYDTPVGHVLEGASDLSGGEVVGEHTTAGYLGSA